MMATLHSKTLGQGEPAILIHGLFGQGTNLQAQAVALAEDYQVSMLDLPNHGRSLALDSTALAVMADELLNWLDAHHLDKVALLGHSLGGKVAMELALTHPDRVSALVVADIAPVTYTGRRHDNIFAGIRAVAAEQPASRREAGAVLARYIDDDGVIAFLLVSLTRGEQGHYNQWRFNWPVLEAGYSELLAAPAALGPYKGPVLFIKGAESDYLLAEHQSDVMRLFPRASIKVMAGCGHWLHAEQPRLFNNIVRRFLAQAQV